MRDVKIDVYRVCLMLGICLLHSITQAGHNTAWAANMLMWCVPGFMFISGWFGIKFSIGKVLKLYGISLYCATMYVVFDVAISGGGGNCIIRAYNIAKGQWFLNAYVIVMCLAPIVNLAVERITIREIIPLVLCAFGWSFATTLPDVNRYIPESSGLTAYSFLTLLGVYVVARFARKTYDVNCRSFELTKSIKVVVQIVLVCLILAALGLGDYNSPFAIVIAGGIFFIIKCYEVPVWLGRVCMWLGPSMFSVYLMHSHEQAFGYLKAIQNALLAHSLPLALAYALTSGLVFFVCVIADFPRRAVVSIINKVR